MWLTAEEKLVTSAHVSFTENSEATDFLEHVLIDDGQDGDETAVSADTAGADTADTDTASQTKASEQQSTPTQQSSTPTRQSSTTQQTSPRQQQDPTVQRMAKIARRSARLNRLAQSPGHRTLLDFINSNVATASNTEHTDDDKAMLVQRLAENEEAYCFIGMNSTVPTAEDEPTLKEAMAGPYAKEWQAAIDSELTGMWEKGVFSDTALPHDKKPVGTRFVMKIKRNADGTIDRFKARLVAQGFSQQQGVDFFETFSPVVSADTLRTLIALAAANGWRIEALDFTQAYLNADLEEDLWAKLPDGSIVKVNKALYGFKQSALKWFEALRETITVEQNWLSSQYDDCLYYRINSDGAIAIVCTYVDDLLFTGDDQRELDRMKAALLAKYPGRDIGVPDQLFGIQITLNADGIMMEQTRYATDIVTGIMGSLDVRMTTTPIDPGMDISATQSNEQPLSAGYMYAHHVGKLMYLAGMTRPDLSNAVRELGRRASSPCLRHWRALQHVARYLAGTLNIGIMYQKSPGNIDNMLVGYSDSDWATDPETRRSVTGYMIMLNDAPVAFKSKTQASVTASTSEAEWTAMAYGMRHGVHLRGMLSELTFPQLTTTWCEDNKGAIRAGTIIGFSGRTRHVDVQLKITREYVLRGHFKVEYASSAEQLADALTKRLTGPKLKRFVQAILWAK